MSYYSDVKEWNIKAGHYVRSNAGFANNNQQKQQLALRLVNEEYNELIQAWTERDIWELADACADLVWVVCGFAGAHGIDLDAAWSEVKRTNWDKLQQPRRFREDGKLLKPDGWKPPDMIKAICKK